MNTELVIERFNSLPENLQFQVFDYIEFLKSRYSKSDKKEKVEPEEISPEIKKLLDDRIANYEKNPHKVKKWEDIENRLLKKHNYAV